MDFTQLLMLALEHQASDLHLSAGLPPLLRVDGDLHPLNLPILKHQALSDSIEGLMNERQRQDYASHLETDFSFTFGKQARFRVNAFQQERGCAAVLRVIRFQVPTLEALGLPAFFTEVASLPRGLVLVTGPAGSGKSTTLAAMVDYMNRTRPHHVLTIEDPIEFLHQSKKCLIHQRELYRDTLNLEAALRSALRENPDVILVGELRDLETIRLAIRAAESGCLVLATLHTYSAVSSISRIVDLFPGEERSMVRSMLADSLQVVITQQLLKKRGGGRLPAFEIMLCNTAIRHLIREDKKAQIYSAIQTGGAKGMQTMEQHLIQLVQEGLIERETGQAFAMRLT